MQAKKVLICDDEPQLRELIASCLCMKGFQVQEATDGIDCLNRIEHDPPDVLLLDINMPRASGLQVLEQLAKKSLELPIIVLSGAYKKPDRNLIFPNAIFISKPFAIEQLVRSIENMCSQKITIDINYAKKQS